MRDSKDVLFFSPNSRLFFSSIDEGERILLFAMLGRCVVVFLGLDRCYLRRYLLCVQYFYTALILEGGAWNNLAHVLYGIFRFYL